MEIRRSRRDCGRSERDKIKNQLQCNKGGLNNLSEIIHNSWKLILSWKESNLKESL